MMTVVGVTDTNLDDFIRKFIEISDIRNTAFERLKRSQFNVCDTLFFICLNYYFYDQNNLNFYKSWLSAFVIVLFLKNLVKCKPCILARRKKVGI